ncbi:hypothetical protein JSQ81_08505 [Sporosarcina sp. Marseille-Q4063]|uniref:hypothetical protein n=1 Tax=Sporosarcina sp. Marseille-Q4063 TaxID=2810514 RepID=UPI001BB03B7C|nr:hypothetical protein [Sporosarcina sp. Marseille-Q4063]QUW23525.1 hypothetical protein JSQ81_08505 [Sporosarcina sp. Marseille-Q4063]
MLIIGILFIWNLVELTIVYLLLNKKKLLVDDRFIMTMCTAITSVSSLVVALQLKLLLDDRAFFLFPMIVALLIGWRFGSLLKAPAALNGIYNGIIGGVMGTMLGAVLKNPALCKIPMEAESMIEINMLSLATFAACLLTLVCRIVRYSFKV